MKRLATRVWTIAALVAVLWFYQWNVAITGALAPPTGVAQKYDYYNHLVHGFLKGHLYLDLEVPAALKALPDPYDPAANREFALIDTTYYRGHYYLYFGATPAVTLMLPFRALTGHDLPPGWAVLIFTSVGFLALAGLWLALRGRYFPDSAGWTAPLGVVTLGFACLAGALVRRPLFWELAVAGGFAFAMLALAAVYQAIHDERRAARWMAAAGVCLGFAVGARPTYAFGAALMLVPLWVRWRAAGCDRSWWRMALASGAALGAMALALMAYNYGRFDHPFELGHDYQLSVAYESKVRQFSPSNFFYNLRLYYFLPAQWSWHAPFVAPTPTPASEAPAGFYTVDYVFGLLAVFPFAWLAFLAPLAVRGRVETERAHLRAMLLAPAVCSGGVAVLMLFFVAAVARYMVDFVPGFMLLAAVGLLVVERATRTGWRRWIGRLAIFALSCGTIAAAALANFELGRTLAEQHPQIVARIERLTTRLEAAADRLRGRHYGPVEWVLAFPRDRTTGVETLVRAGQAPLEDRLLVEYLGGGAVRFGVQSGGEPATWGTVRSIARDAEHRLAVDLGCFYPPLAHRTFDAVPYARASWLRQQATVTLDGRSALQALHAFQSHRLGAPREPDREFTGTLRSFTPRAVDRTPRPIGPAPREAIAFTRPGGDAGSRFPVLATGRRGAGDLLFLELLPDNRARLGYDHWGAPLRHGPEFALPPGGGHTLELRQDEGGWSRIAEGVRSLALWLDGRPAWHTSVPVYPCARDEVWLARNPNGHSACAPELPRAHAGAAAPRAAEAPGGALWLRLRLPVGVKGSWQPLLAAGGKEGGDLLSLYYIDRNAVELRFDHHGSPLLLSSRIEVDPTQPHEVEVFLPSFAVDAFGREATGEMWVRWNGREVLRATTAAAGFAADALVLGENVLGRRAIARGFDGVVVHQEWIGATTQ